MTHQRDALNTERRNLPMVEITKEYSFEGPEGKVDLLDLFGSRAAEAVCATSKVCGSPGLGSCRTLVAASSGPGHRSAARLRPRRSLSP